MAAGVEPMVVKAKGKLQTTRMDLFGTIVTVMVFPIEHMESLLLE
jgi:hypothetical protein